MYIVQNKRHGRRVGVEEGTDTPTMEWFEIGDAIEPTEFELKSFPDRFFKTPEPKQREVAKPEGDSVKRGPGRPAKSEG